MTHEMPFKKLILKFSRKAYSWKYSWNFLQLSLTHELLTKQLWNSLSKVEKLEIWTFKLPVELTHEMGHENTQKTCFSHKNNLKNFEKHGWYKSLPKANKKNKNHFGLIHIWLSTHISHLSMYNHTNEISINWTKLVCCGWVSNVE